MHRMLSRTLVLSCVLFLVSGCESEAPQGPTNGIACGECLPGQACDRSTGNCETAIAEAEPCGEGIEGVCDEGMTCGAVADQGPHRCSKPCSATTAAEVCGEGGRCFARPGQVGASDGFCARPAGEGDTCDNTKLTFCSGRGLSCITPTRDRTDGQCFRLCDPGLSPTDCGSGQVCADPFPSTPEKGICVAPIPAGEKCDHTQLKFCGTGELCARPGPDTWGFCHKRCTADTDCTSPQTCVEPTEGIRFCSDAVPLDGRCSAPNDLYCARGDMCVRVGSDTLCKRDCTDSGTCPTGTCSTLDGSERKACL